MQNNNTKAVVSVKELRANITAMATEMNIEVAAFAKEAGLEKFNGNSKRADVELVHDRMKGVYNERKKLVEEITKLGGKADMTMSRQVLNKMYRELYAKAAEQNKPQGKSQSATKPAVGETPAAGKNNKGGANMANNKNTKANKQNQQGGEQPMIVMTPDVFSKELRAAIAEATKPLHAAIEQLKEENDSLRKQLAAKSQPKAEKKNEEVKKDVKTNEPTPEEIRAEYIAANEEMKEAFNAYSQAIKSGDQKAIAETKAAYDKAFNKVTAMNKNPKIREHVADFFFNVADGVERYGHAGVATVRDVMHKAVDITCNVLDKGVDVTANTLRATGNIIAGNGLTVNKPATNN